MYRSGIGPLKAWKEKEGHLPLVIHGARQVGKSWLVDEFGRTCFKNVVKLDFDKNKNNAKLFGDDISPERLLKRISAATGQRIVPGGTLLFFDEIQEAPRAMTSLKYFAEDAPEYHVIAAGSLLGITEHSGHSFPVGKVEFFDLYPMTFKEFLIADGQEGLAGLLDDDIRELEPFHDTREQFDFFSEFLEILFSQGYAGFSGLIEHEFHIGEDIAGILPFGYLVTHSPEFFRSLSYRLDKTEFLHVPGRKCPVEVVDQGDYQFFSHTEIFDILSFKDSENLQLFIFRMHL